jgi:hypothetical protein
MNGYQVRQGKVVKPSTINKICNRYRLEVVARKQEAEKNNKEKNQMKAVKLG